jgi:hypothetical protein
VRPDGFIVRFTVEMMFDRNNARTAYDLVAQRVVCQECGGTVKVTVPALRKHAHTHEPSSREWVNG